MRKNAKLPLPQQFREVNVIQCDGCGAEEERPVLFLLPNEQISMKLGWLHQQEPVEDGTGNVDKQAKDFCPDCRPKILRAQKQESEAIKAEKMAALAETSGIA